MCLAWCVAGASAQACADLSCELETVGVEGAAGLSAGGGEADVWLFVCGGKDGREVRECSWWRGGWRGIGGKRRGWRGERCRRDAEDESGASGGEAEVRNEGKEIWLCIFIQPFLSLLVTFLFKS